MMFYGASAFNGDISSWDVSNGVDFVSTQQNTFTFFSTRIYAASGNEIDNSVFSK